MGGATKQKPATPKRAGLSLLAAKAPYRRRARKRMAKTQAPRGHIRTTICSRGPGPQGSKLGREVAVDLEANAHFDESRGGPGHERAP